MTYGDQDYQRDPLGLRPIIEKATREQLLQIKTEVFVPENMALLIAGDFSAAALPPLVEKYFSHWQTPKGWQRPKRPAFPAYPQTQEFVMTRPAVQNATIQIAYAGPRARTESEDTFAADVLAHLLGQRSGKFFQKYVESGLTFGAGLSYYTQSEAGEVELFAQTTPENAVKVKDMLLAEVNEWMKPDYFSKNALEDVRLQLVVNHQREQNQPSEFVKTLAFWWAITGFDYYRSYIPSLQKIEFAQIKAFVQKYLVDKPHLTMTLLSPEDAERVKLKDTSVELVKKYLGDYARGS
jgi:zinc protease